MGKTFLFFKIGFTNRFVIVFGCFFVTAFYVCYSVVQPHVHVYICPNVIFLSLVVHPLFTLLEVFHFFVVVFFISTTLCRPYTYLSCIYLEVLVSFSAPLPASLFHICI